MRVGGAGSSAVTCVAHAPYGSVRLLDLRPPPRGRPRPVGCGTRQPVKSIRSRRVHLTFCSVELVVSTRCFAFIAVSEGQQVACLVSGSVVAVRTS